MKRLVKSEDLRQFRDTPYYLNTDGEVFHKLKKGYKKLNCGNETIHGCKRIRANIHGQKIPVSRMMWEVYHGEIPKGYAVIHRNGCSTMNDIGNLELVKKNQCHRHKPKMPSTMKIINLKTGRIYKGTRQASDKLGHSRQLVRDLCRGKKPLYVDLQVAYWDDINHIAFRGDYQKYFNKHMKEGRNNELGC